MNQKAPEEPKRSLKSTLLNRLRTYFIAGILITGPISITIYIAWLFIRFVDRQVGLVIPATWHPQLWGLPGIGLLAVVVALTVVGALTAGLAGRIWLRVTEAVMARTPVLRGLYSAIKQIFETVLAHKSQAFREVALIEYPRRGIWTIAFITGATIAEIERHAENNLLNVFVPTTPNPTSGFLLFMPRSEVMVLNMTVEEGLKLVISGGIVAPADHTPALEARELPAESA